MRKGKPAFRRHALTPLFRERDMRLQIAGVCVWLVALCYFWFWWLDPDHNIGTARYILTTSVLVWTTILPLYFIAIFLRARRWTGDVALPAGSRVAMVVTKAPSEPFVLVRQTLEAILAQDYPHDTWLADEEPDEETIEWCTRHGVRISTRKDAQEYHRKSWPRRTRCKEGNLAYFYDHFGYRLYDFVVQMDADHVPAPGYLREMLKPFADPGVGYVSAPSICDRNADQSWSARGRLFTEATLHGLLQAGYNSGWAPLCIGSHYAVRTKALDEIGGLGPELAEDHSTTLMMNSHGWQGVHAFDAIAHGEGPRTFTDLITQEFQWSRSLVNILLNWSPKYLPSLPARLKFQFLFCQLWYPLFGLFMLLMYLMPIIALATTEKFVGVTYIAFLVHSLSIWFILVFMAAQWKARGWYRPVDAKVIGWESLLFVFARWPWVLAGTLAALRDWSTHSFVDFRVTPKGSHSVYLVPWGVVIPYATLSLVSGVTALVVDEAGAARGFYIFAIANCLIYSLLVAVIVIRHCLENGVAWRTAPSRLLTQACLIASLALLPIAAATARGPAGLEALTWGSKHLELTRVTYTASGAGMRKERLRQVRLRNFWAKGNEMH